MSDIRGLVAEELSLPVDPRVSSVAKAIAAKHGAAYYKRWLAIVNRLVPPNVFYFEQDGLVAKYAVLSEADFRRLTGPETSSVAVWARFAQPSRLVWAADDAARENTVEAVSRAAPTLLAAARPRATEDPFGLWRR